MYFICLSSVIFFVIIIFGMEGKYMAREKKIKLKGSSFFDRHKPINKKRKSSRVVAKSSTLSLRGDIYLLLLLRFFVLGLFFGGLLSFKLGARIYIRIN